MALEGEVIASISNQLCSSCLHSLLFSSGQGHTLHQHVQPQFMLFNIDFCTTTVALLANLMWKIHNKKKEIPPKPSQGRIRMYETPLCFLSRIKLALKCYCACCTRRATIFKPIGLNVLLQIKSVFLRAQNHASNENNAIALYTPIEESMAFQRVLIDMNVSECFPESMPEMVPSLILG